MSKIEEYTWLNELFGEPIYLIAEQASEGNKKDKQTTGNAAVSLAYSGDYTNGIVVVHQYSGNSFENEANYVLLKKILGALHGDIAQSALVNLKENPEAMSFDTIRQELSPKKALFFLPNSSLEQFAFNISRYQVENFTGETTIVLADDFEHISKDQQLKKQLWAALQKAFA